MHWNDAHPYIAQEQEDGAATLQNQFIYNLKDGAECGFKYFLFDGTEKQIGLRIRGKFSGEIQVILDDPDGSPVAAIEVTEGERWHWDNARLSVLAGTHALYFKVSGQGSCDLDAFAIS